MGLYRGLVCVSPLVPVTSVRGAVDLSATTARTHFTARPRQASDGGRGQVCLCSSRKGWVHGGSLLGGAFRRTRDANKQETPSPSYFGNWAFPSATGVASGQEADQPLAPRPRGPAPALAPPPARGPAPAPAPPPGRACSVGRVGLAGLRGCPWLPAPAQPADATSRRCGSFLGSYMRKRLAGSRGAGRGGLGAAER